MTEEEKDYSNIDVDDLLPDEINEQIQRSLVSLQKLYDEEIDNDDTTVQKALEYLPLFNIHGLLLSSMLGVTMEEYYMITEAYAKQLGFLSE